MSVPSYSSTTKDCGYGSPLFLGSVIDQNTGGKVIIFEIQRMIALNINVPTAILDLSRGEARNPIANC